MSPTRAKRLGRSPVVAYVAVLAVLTVGLVKYQGSVTDAIHDNQVQGCERAKLDRTASAAALRAQSDYLNLVLGAASVKEDVKAAARVNQRAQNDSAFSLESRTGDRLDCKKVFAK